MKFLEAIAQAIMYGKKIRHVYWPPNICLEYDEETFFIYGWDLEYHVTSIDAMAEWEIYDPK